VTRDRKVLRLAAEPASATRARHAAVALADELGASRDTRSGVAVAVTEAVANAIVHAYRGIAATGVEVALSGDSGGMDVEIRDRGVGLRPRDDSPGLGLGLGLMAQLADRFEVADVDGGGTCVRLHFALP
jgi:anti-sigma regulatory factor (Ser/Thr protein kinase)